MRNWSVWMELSPDPLSGESLLILVDEIPFCRWPIRVQSIRAAGVEMASCVEVAFSGYMSITQTLNSLLGIKVEEDVVVPCVSVRVEEEDRVQEILVVVNCVGKIYHGPMALVFWHFQG
jgi:hypothetical protein